MTVSYYKCEIRCLQLLLREHKNIAQRLNRHKTHCPLTSLISSLAPGSTTSFTSFSSFSMACLSTSDNVLTLYYGQRICPTVLSKKRMLLATILLLVCSTLLSSQVPRREKTGEKSAWYTLYVHALNLNAYVVLFTHIMSGCGCTMPMPSTDRAHLLRLKRWRRSIEAL